MKAQELHHKEAEYTETMNSSRLKLYGLQSRAKFAKDIRDKYKSLSEMGVLAELQYLEAEERFDNLKNEVNIQSNEQKILESVMEQQIKNLRGQLADLKSKATDAKVTLKYQNIISPVDGIVHS